MKSTSRWDETDIALIGGSQAKGCLYTRDEVNGYIDKARNYFRPAIFTSIIGEK